MESDGLSTPIQCRCCEAYPSPIIPRIAREYWSETIGAGYFTHVLYFDFSSELVKIEHGKRFLILLVYLQFGSCLFWQKIVLG